MSKYRWMRHLLALLLLLAIAVPCLPARAATVSLPQNYRSIAENARFIVGLDTSNCFFCIADKQIGKIYYSNPENWKSDKLAAGSAKAKLRSQLVVSVLRTETGNVETVTSYAGSISKGNVKLLRHEDGLEIRYTFADYGITVPLRIAIGEDSFRIYVSAEGIEESGEDRLLEIELVPFFGAAGAEDTGYILLPDGGGALMRFNNGKGSVGVYKAQVYGVDKAFSGTVDNNTAMRAALPVMGLHYETYGLLAVADQGDSHAYLNAATAGGTNSYNNASFSFSVRSRGEYVIGEENYNSRTINLYQQGISSAGEYSVTWYPLPEEESDYIGMARRYGQLLFEGAQAKTDKPRLMLNLYGMIYKNKPVLGIPVSQAVPLTTYKDAQDILKAFSDKGIDTMVQYLNFSNNAARNKRDGIKASGTLGGEKAWRALLTEAEKSDTPIYATTNVLSFTSENALISRFTLAATQLSSFPVKLNRYLISTHKADDSTAEDYVLKASVVEREAESMLSAYEDLGAGVSLGDAANLLYSDYSEDDGQRDALVAAIENLYARVGSALESFPNAYALPHAGYVSDVPFASSHFSCADETVPFYAYVLRGHLSFATESVNLSDAPEHMLLHAMETSADLAFTFVARNSDELRFSDASELYACDYASWADTAEEMQEALTAVRLHTDALEIVNRQNDAGLVTVLYEDGTRLMLNYDNEARVTDVGTLESGAWRLVKP